MKPEGRGVGFSREILQKQAQLLWELPLVRQPKELTRPGGCTNWAHALNTVTNRACTEPIGHALNTVYQLGTCTEHSYQLGMH